MGMGSALLQLRLVMRVDGTDLPKLLQVGRIDRVFWETRPTTTKHDDGCFIVFPVCVCGLVRCGVVWCLSSREYLEWIWRQWSPWKSR